MEPEIAEAIGYLISFTAGCALFVFLAVVVTDWIKR